MTYRAPTSPGAHGYRGLTPGDGPTTIPPRLGVRASHKKILVPPEVGQGGVRTDRDLGGPDPTQTLV